MDDLLRLSCGDERAAGGIPAPPLLLLLLITTPCLALRQIIVTFRV